MISQVQFQLTPQAAEDTKSLQQFELSLLATRVTTPSLPIHVIIPTTFYYPSTWQTLEAKGIQFVRSDAITDRPKGTHTAVCNLAKLWYPNTPEHELQPPNIPLNFSQAMQWLADNRTNDTRIWLPINPTLRHLFNHPNPHVGLPCLEWLQWAFWLKTQPPHQPKSGNMVFTRKTKMKPPSRGM